MTLSNAIQVFAGTMILVALILGATVSEAVGFWLLVFIAVNLIQSAFTGFCPAAMVLKNMPFIKA
ncbi:MAG: DUF2892 domain-containing protein [Candidatus Thiothrix sulfatifontis]|nr:MAG: DUF2892 domain-containing protein [Candidatus Thiothrix sulfatifontis]